MTDTTQSFGDQAQAVAAPEETAKANRTKLLALVAAGAVVAGAGAYLLLGSHGSSSDDVALAPLTRPRAAVPAKAAVKAPAKAAPKKAVAPTSLVPAAASAVHARDPFHVQYLAPAAVAAGTGVGGAAPVTPVSTGTTPTTTTGTSTAPGTSTSTSTTPSAYALQLVSVTDPRPEARFFTFRVGTDSKTVISGQRFGKYGELVVLGYTKDSRGKVNGAVLQVGDDSPVVIDVGEKMSVL